MCDKIMPTNQRSDATPYIDCGREIYRGYTTHLESAFIRRGFSVPSVGTSATNEALVDKRLFDSRSRHMYYNYLTMHGFKFPITVDGVIVNPCHYPELCNRSPLDGKWEMAVQAIMLVYPLLYDLIVELNGSGETINSLEDAVQFIQYHDGLGGFDGAAFMIQQWQSDGWLEIPQDLDWLLQAIYRRMYPQKSKTVKQTEPVPLGRQGWVYLVQSPTGAYKIGRTRSIKNRLKTFAVKLPFEVELLHTIQCENYIAAEAELHALFASKRVNGEWFQLDDQDVADIKAITRM